MNPLQIISRQNERQLIHKDSTLDELSNIREISVLRKVKSNLMYVTVTRTKTMLDG
jgi:hypothetical protein